MSSQEARSRPAPSLPLPSPTPSHIHLSSTTLAPTPVPLPARPATRQLYLAVPTETTDGEGNEREASPTRLGSSPPQVPVGQAVVQPLNGARTPSYGPLGSNGDAQEAPQDWRRRNRGPNAVVGEERLSKRPRVRERRDFAEWMEGLQKRQYPYAEGYPSCSEVSNAVLSCYPETNTTLVQGDYSKFIWNSRYPTFIGAGSVDVYLYNADTDDIAVSWLNQTNAEGMVSILPSDNWWADPTQTAASWFNSESNRTTPYYFVVVDGGSDLTGGEVHQATFDVIQTAAPSTLSSSLAALTSSSVSSASSVSVLSASSASSASLVSASSLLSASSSRAVASASSACASNTSLCYLTSTAGRSSSTSSRSSGRSGDLQNNSSGGAALPKWAIAVIVVLGTLALVAGALAVYFCLGRARKRRNANALAGAEGQDAETIGDDDITNGSRDPILGAEGGRGSAMSSAIGGGGRAGPGALAGLAAGAGGTAAIAAAAKDAEKAEDEGTISHTDAARMAEAFRAALRTQPDFADMPGTDDSPGESTTALGGVAASAAAATRGGGGAGAEGEDRPQGPSPTGAAMGNQSSGSGDEQNQRGRQLAEDELRSEGKSVKSVEGGGKRWGRMSPST